MPNAPSQLLAWAVSHGAHLNNIEIRSTAHGKGLFARFTAPGKPSLSIPNSLVISLDRIAEETDGDTGFWDVINRLPESLPTLDIIRTIFLLYQEYLRRDGRADKWGIYLESLPRETLLPIAWSAEEVALLHELAVSIAHPVESKISYMRELWSRLVAGGGWFASVTWEDHVLAASWVSSRTFGKKDVEHVLAPVIDMANHSSEPNANWIIDSDGMQLVLLHDVKEGEEICISYDEGRGVAERVYKYGFIEDRDLRGTSKEVSLVTQRGGTFRVREKCIRNGEYDFCMSDDWYANRAIFP